MRKRLAVLVFAAILVLPGISRAETEQGPPQPTQSLRTQIELTVSASDSAVRAKDPYRSLFPPAGPGSATPDRTSGQAVSAPAPNARPSVVCGLTVIQSIPHRPWNQARRSRHRAPLHVSSVHDEGVSGEVTGAVNTLA